MRTIKPGVPRPQFPWLNRQWRCVECGEVVEFDMSDANKIEYHDERRDVDLSQQEWIVADCPTCKRRTSFEPYVEGA